MTFTGKDLIELGYKPGQWFKDALLHANALLAQGASTGEIEAEIAKFAPPPPLTLRAAGKLDFGINITATGSDEELNVASVLSHMRALMRVPTAVKGAVMPDACPSGVALGTIPVGGVVATKDAIHPGFHSADICCSVAISILGQTDPAAVLDMAQVRTHFGPGGRPEGARVSPPAELLTAFGDNAFLRGLEEDATAHFATQGDGNHFLYVGRLKSTGETAIVTHHGSRKPGAMLYKRGMAAAEAWRKRLSPETPEHSAWIPASEKDGIAYWQALQLIREWTKASHFAIHGLVCDGLNIAVKDRFWNEHNFIFERGGLYYHAKGATPAWADFAADSSGLTLIPLNMAEPILIARGLDAQNGLGFAPHGAGRNFGRRAYLRRLGDMRPEDVFAQQTKGIDARFYCGIPDLSELPDAYKNASTVREQIAQFGLAEIVDEVLPHGSIMAGDWEKPFREKRAAARAAKGA
jgi:tRNA-splicing ligase RtcB (3'-phosphate/5'-hydroxy nucleic acid ligase)